MILYKILPNFNGKVPLVTMLVFIVMGSISSGTSQSSADSGSKVIERHRYMETTGEDSFIFIWERVSADSIHIRTVSTREVHVNDCQESGEIMAWYLKSKSCHVNAHRRYQAICLSGHFKNEKINKCYNIGQDHWYQAPSWALRQFVLSKRKDVDFWMIRSDKLKPIKLRATKNGTDTLMLNGQGIKAFRIRLTLTGLKKRLWRGHYWFRQSDGLFLQYKGVNGLPGTPETLILLQE